VKALTDVYGPDNTARYLELVRQFPLRPIRDEQHHDDAIEFAGQLAEKGEENLTVAEADYLEALAILIERWDDDCGYNDDDTEE